MALTQALRLLENHDSSFVGYKTFHETPIDRYPTFSICLWSDLGPGLKHIFNEDMKNKIGLSAREYQQLLKGTDMVRNQSGTIISFLNVSHVDYNQFTLTLDSLLYAFEFETYDAKLNGSIQKYKESMETIPLYLSYTDPDTLCFTRKSKFESKIIRTKDWLSLDLKYLKSIFGDLHIYIHHPGQLTRSLGSPNFVTEPRQLKPDFSKISLKLNDVSVLRKRTNSKGRCDADLHDDDIRFRQEVIRLVGCVPIYWKSLTSMDGMDDSFKLCTSFVEMSRIFDAIKHKKDIMATYDEPCDHMKVSVGFDQHPVLMDGYVLMELLYMETQYKETTNIREFGFESFWSSVGGFVGIFLGYSIMQIPQLLEDLWGWIIKRRTIKKTSPLDKQQPISCDNTRPNSN